MKTKHYIRLNKDMDVIQAGDVACFEYNPNETTFDTIPTAFNAIGKTVGHCGGNLMWWRLVDKK